MSIHELLLFPMAVVGKIFARWVSIQRLAKGECRENKISQRYKVNVYKISWEKDKEHIYSLQKFREHHLLDILWKFQENSIETCILSRVKQITSPGWMHETSARTWCSGKTWRERVEREVGGGVGMGKTCKLNDISFQCMTKFTKNTKKKRKKESSNLRSTTPKARAGMVTLLCAIQGPWWGGSNAHKKLEVRVGFRELEFEREREWVTQFQMNCW